LLQIDQQSFLSQHETALDNVQREYPQYPRELIESVVFEEFRRVECERAKSDLFYLAKEILGYSDLTESIHRPLCDLVASVNPLIIALRERANAPLVPAHVREHERNLREWQSRQTTSGTSGNYLKYTEANQSGLDANAAESAAKSESGGTQGGGDG